MDLHGGGKKGPTISTFSILCRNKVEKKEEVLISLPIRKLSAQQRGLHGGRKEKGRKKKEKSLSIFLSVGNKAQGYKQKGERGCQYSHNFIAGAPRAPGRKRRGPSSSSIKKSVRYRKGKGGENILHSILHESLGREIGSVRSGRKKKKRRLALLPLLL